MYWDEMTNLLVNVLELIAEEDKTAAIQYN